MTEGLELLGFFFSAFGTLIVLLSLFGAGRLFGSDELPLMLAGVFAAG